MTKKLSSTVYAILKPTRRNGYTNVAGVKEVLEFTVDRFTKNRPATKVNEIAVQLNLTLDSSLFDKISPVVNIELEEGELFANVDSQITVDPIPAELPEKR